MNQETPPQQESDLAIKRKTRLGIYFFFLYFLFYAGFVAIGVLNYELLEYEVIGGVNLAIFYGIGLILFAVILGIVYNFLCSRYEDAKEEEDQV